MANRNADERADQGGMTGATGSLTSDNADEEFIPAETRELTDPTAVRQPRPPARGHETVLGGDEQRDPEDEHL